MMQTISRRTQTILKKTSRPGISEYRSILMLNKMLACFRKFKKDCPNGILEKKKVCEIYETKLKLSKDSKFLVDQLFRIIDDDNNGGIDFRVENCKIMQSSCCSVGQHVLFRSLW